MKTDLEIFKEAWEDYVHPVRPGMKWIATFNTCDILAEFIKDKCSKPITDEEHAELREYLKKKWAPDEDFL